jgi:glycerol-3-phosphate dehydrogenase
MQTRTELFDHLEHESFDLLIVGAGITGAGAARDAALRGLKVALVDQGDIGGGTSSRSSKLVHGGLRYLAGFQLGLVRESTAERWVQMTLAPHLVRPLEFLMPIYDFHKHGRTFIGMGLWLYDALAMFRVPRHRSYKGRRALTRQPNLRTDGLTGALRYFDAATDDARLTLENALDAEVLGATVASYAKLVAFRTDAAGHVHGAEVQDVHSGRTVSVKAQLVLNTTGPWTDEVLGLRAPQPKPLLRPTKGAHLVFSADRLPVEAAVVLVHPRDQRPMFAIPWGPHVYVGTTDIDYTGDLARPFAAEDDRELILEAANTYFPEAALTAADIVGSWCGLRPLVAPEKGKAPSSRVSREHILMGGEDGLITMTGGKLTTYRLMAKWLVDRAARFLRSGPPRRAVPGSTTKRRPLPGAVGLAEAGGLTGLRDRLAAQPGVTGEVAQHLVDGYGTRAEAVLAAARGTEDLALVVPGNPVTWAELTHAVTAEHATTLEDFLGRRTQLVFRAPEASLTVIDAVADRMGALLGWTPERRGEEIAAYRAEVAGRLRCKG